MAAHQQYLAAAAAAAALHNNSLLLPFLYHHQAPPPSATQTPSVNAAAALYGQTLQLGSFVFVYSLSKNAHVDKQFRPSKVIEIGFLISSRAAFAESSTVASIILKNFEVHRVDSFNLKAAVSATYIPEKTNKNSHGRRRRENGKKAKKFLR
uniref:Uncharacterized protein n=1 Tax=Romanomermis culicivorax TaxID=13658 RepID=A0A915K9X9_ROMCU